MTHKIHGLIKYITTMEVELKNSIVNGMERREKKSRPFWKLNEPRYEN